MGVQQEMARQFRQAHTVKNWTGVGLRDTLDKVSYEESTTKIGSCNTILALTYHIFYYIHGVLGYLKDGKLEIRDKFSFDHPDISSSEEWTTLKEKGYVAVEELAQHIENLPEDKFYEIFFDTPYGTYFRNFAGIAEHTHYHHGQIVLLRKLITAQKS